MAKEIERKFLVTDSAYIDLAVSSVRLRQGYLCRHTPGGCKATVRVRIKGDSEARITIKGPNAGAVRSEWEYAIPVADAEAMLSELASGTVIDKTRYIVPAAGGLVWEVDRFHGAHEGLVVAEIELPSAETPLPQPLPAFVGREVTGDARYYNSNL